MSRGFLGLGMGSGVSRSGGGYSPLSLPSLGRWYDFSDESTHTLTSDKISALADKSGNGRNLTTESATYHCAVGTVNGLSTGLFTSPDTLYHDSTGGIPNGIDQPFTLFFVMQRTVDNGLAVCIGFNSTYDADPFHYFAATTSSQIITSRRDDVRASNPAITDTPNTDYDAGPIVLTYAYTGTNMVVRDGGTQLSSTSMDTIQLNNIDRFSVGSSHQTTSYFNPFDGHICEIIYSDAYLSGLDLLRAEDYLKDKWGA